MEESQAMIEGSYQRIVDAEAKIAKTAAAEAANGGGDEGGASATTAAAEEANNGSGSKKTKFSSQMPMHDLIMAEARKAGIRHALDEAGGQSDGGEGDKAEQRRGGAERKERGGRRDRGNKDGEGGSRSGSESSESNKGGRRGRRHSGSRKRSRRHRKRSESGSDESDGGGDRRSGKKGKKRGRSEDESSEDGGGRRSSRDRRSDRDRRRRSDKDRSYRRHKSRSRSSSRSASPARRDHRGGGGGYYRDSWGGRDRRRDDGGWGRGGGGGPRVMDYRGSPPWRRGGGGRDRSPPPHQQRGRIPGPERRDVLDSLSMPFTPRRPPPKDARTDMSTEERDERTIFILQLHPSTRPRDLEDFFSAVGTVRDVRIITDSKTRKSKGIAYVEFWEREGVPLAMGLNGQKIVGRPITIQMTCAERNRLANGAQSSNIGLGLMQTQGPMKLCVANLHPNISDDMLLAIFEPFGKVERCEIQKESDGVTSKCQGYVTFRSADEGKRALEQLNMFELAERPMRLSTVEMDEAEVVAAGGTVANRQRQQQQEKEDRLEERYGAPDRQQLMAKLAEGTGLEVPRYQPPQAHGIVPTASSGQWPGQQQQPPTQASAAISAAADSTTADATIPAYATQCFMLSNMFDPKVETDPGWELDVRDDVIEECNNNGGLVHIFVDKASADGNVYVKCPTVAAAHRSVSALHGRWFSGKVITANYVPVDSYHQLFAEARLAQELLKPRPRRA